MYGNIDYEQRRWSSAKRSYESCLKIGLTVAPIHPITAAAYYSLGCVEFEMKHPEKARYQILTLNRFLKSLSLDLIDFS